MSLAYRVIRSVDADELAQAVEQLAAEGFAPSGAIAAVWMPEGDAGQMIYMQALVRMAA